MEAQEIVDSTENARVKKFKQVAKVAVQKSFKPFT